MILQQLSKAITIEILLDILFQKYLNSYCIVVIAESRNFSLPSLPVPFVKLNLENLKTNLMKVSDIGCLDIVIESSNPKVIVGIFNEVIRESYTRNSERKIIFVTNDCKSNLIDVLKLKEISFIPNVLIVNSNNCETATLVTHKYTGTKSMEPKELDTFYIKNKTFKNNANLFPNKLDNLEGKILKAACFNYRPFVILDLDENVAKFGRDGIDMRILEEFCRRHNCKIELVRDDANAWGNIYDNGTGNGVIGNVFEDKADFATTGVGQWHSTSKFLDLSAYCVKSSIICIAPAAKVLSKWELPLIPFTWTMWLVIFVTAAVSCVALAFVQGGSSQRAVFSVYSIIVAQPQGEKNKSWRRRSVIVWVMLSSLLLNNAYGSGLSATFMVLKYEKSVDTVQDLVDRRMLWAATHEAWIFSLMPAQELKIKQLLKQFRAYDMKELRSRSYDRNMAFGVVKMAAGYISIGDFLTEEVVSDYELMEESLYFTFSVIMGRKGSPYIARLNELILRLHESGLMLAWETQVVLKHLNYKVQQAVRLSKIKKKQQIEPLGYRHVMGVFFIFIVGVLLSLLAFLKELLHK